MVATYNFGSVYNDFVKVAKIRHAFVKITTNRFHSSLLMFANKW